jgi:hypothetical protein
MDSAPPARLPFPAVLQITLRWDRKGALGARGFAVGAPAGEEVRGEVDDSLLSPPYQVQHVVVDTADGRLVTTPGADLERAESVAERLNAASFNE